MPTIHDYAASISALRPNDAPLARRLVLPESAAWISLDARMTPGRYRVSEMRWLGQEACVAGAIHSSGWDKRSRCSLTTSEMPRNRFAWGS